MSLRIVFMGTPDFAVPTLMEIVGAGHEVAAIYTQPPRPAGRGMGERKSPVHEAGERFGLPVFTPLNFSEEADRAQFAAHDADVAVVVAYGLILPQAVLDAPREGCLNLHASLLPRWRGAAPINRAVMAGDRETGVAVMRMEASLDTGPVGLEERIAISPDMTAGELHDLLARRGADLVHRALGALERGALSFSPQSEEGVTYAKKIEKAEARIDWSQSAEEVYNRIRGLSPFPGAWFEVDFGGKGQRVKVLRATLADGGGISGKVLDDRLTVACGTGAVRLLALQRAGKGAMDTDTFLRGNPIAPGARLA